MPDPLADLAALVDEYGVGYLFAATVLAGIFAGSGDNSPAPAPTSGTPL